MTAQPGTNLRVNGDRLWDMLMEMAKIGPGIAGGNNRQTLTELQNYMSNGAKATLGTKYRIVPNAQSAPAGAKVLNLRAAITGVSAANDYLTANTCQSSFSWLANWVNCSLALAATAAPALSWLILPFS